MDRKDIQPKDLRIRTYVPMNSSQGAWSSGRDNGVAILHIPSGIEASSHVDRSQHRNRAIAMEKLVKRLEDRAALAQSSHQPEDEAITVPWSDADINSMTMDLLGKWPSFEAQSWACKVVHALAVVHLAQDLKKATPQPDDTKVICPNCSHQFRAIPVEVQTMMLNVGFTPPFSKESLALKKPRWVAVGHVRHFEYSGIGVNGFSQEPQLMDGSPFLPDGTILYALIPGN